MGVNRHIVHADDQLKKLLRDYARDDDGEQ